MPRIEAPTVAEHSAMRRKQVVDAAAAVLVDKGLGGFTPGAVAARAGLARSSIYQYHPSTEALLGAAVGALLQGSRDRMRAAVSGALSPRERVEAYVRAAISDATSGHGDLSEVARMQMPDSCREAVRQLHGELLEPLRDALQDSGIDDPAVTAALISGVVNAAVTGVNHGGDADALTTEAVTFVLRATRLD